MIIVRQKPQVQIGSLAWMKGNFELVARKKIIHSENTAVVGISELETIVGIVDETLEYAKNKNYLEPFRQQGMILSTYLDLLLLSFEKYQNQQRGEFTPIQVGNVKYIFHRAVFPTAVDNIHFTYCFEAGKDNGVSKIRTLHTKVKEAMSDFNEFYEQLVRDVVFKEHRSSKNKDHHILIFPQMKKDVSSNDMTYRYLSIPSQQDTSGNSELKKECMIEMEQYPSQNAALHAVQKVYPRARISVTIANEDAAYYSTEYTLVPLFIHYLTEKLTEKLNPEKKRSIILRK